MIFNVFNIDIIKKNTKGIISKVIYMRAIN